jgi:PAS domain S-box-containing protein
MEQRRAAMDLAAISAEPERRVEERTAARDWMLQDLHEGGRFRQLIEAAADAIMRLDLEGRFLYVSPAYLGITGFTWEDLERTSVLEIIHPEDRQGVAERLALLARDTEPRRARGRARRKDGSHYWYETVSRGWRDPETGEIAEIHSIARDITEQVRTEEALKESEARFRLLAEHSTDMIARHGPDGVYLYVSPASKRLLGYAPEEMIGRNAVEFILREDYAAIYRALTSAGHGSPSFIMYRARRKNGVIVWLESSWHLVHGEDDATIVEWQSSTRDVSECVQDRELLAASEARYRLLAEHSGDMFATTDGDGTIQYVSPAALQLTGYTPEELIGQPQMPYVHPDDRPIIEARMMAARTEGGVATVRVRIVRKDGSIVWSETVARAVLESGRNPRIYSVTRDITKSVRNEQALREREELFRRIFDESPAPMALTDNRGTLTQVNDAYAHLLGYERHELVGRNFLDVTHPDEQAVAEEAWRGLFAGTLPTVHRRKRYRTRDGRARTGMLTASAIHNASGEVVAIISIVEDISEQLRIGEELQRIAAMKSDFVTLVSHELRAPLTNLLGGLELVGHDRDRLPESAQRTLAILTDEASRLNRFVETILDVSRLDADQLPVVPGPVAINVVIDRAMRAIAGSSASHPVVDIASDLPLAWADELHLEHVFRNLIHNAAQHSPPGEPIVIEAKAGDGEIEVQVTDRGPGISAEDLPHVFEAFRRSQRADVRYKGYGLGLYFAKRLIEVQGGRVEAASPAPGGSGRGARFTVHVPLAQEGGDRHGPHLAR